jgi:PEP-CTERM motif
MNLLLKPTLAAVLLCAAAGAQAAVTVGVDSRHDWIGFMNWSDLPEDGGNLSGQGFWGVPDLAARFAADTLTLSPNTSTDRDMGTSPLWWKPDGSSNKIMSANLLVIDDSLVGQDIVFAGTVLGNTLADGYSSRAFIRAFNADYSAIIGSADLLLQGGQAFEVRFQSTPDHAHIQYGFDTIGPNARVGNSLGSVVISAVPEPSAFAMLAAGLLGLVLLRARRPSGRG